MHEYESRSGNDQLSLYVYDQRGRYPGGVSFGEAGQMSTDMARQATENATAQHREVRITDSQDNLVYHSVAGKTNLAAGRAREVLGIVTEGTRSWRARSGTWAGPGKQPRYRTGALS